MSFTRTVSCRRTALVAVSALVSVVLAVEAPASADPRDRLDRIRERRERVDRHQERLDAQSDDLSTRIRALDADRASAEANLEEVDGRLARIDALIGRLTDEMETAQKKLAAVSIHLGDVRDSLARNQALLEDRAVAAYKAGPTAAVDSLLSADSFSDLLSRYVYYESALGSDAELVSEIEQLESQTEDRQNLVEIQQSVIAADKLEVQRQRDEVARVRSQRAALLAAKRTAIAEKSSLLEEVQNEQSELNKVERQLERESGRIQGLLSGGSTSSSSSAGPASYGRFVWPASGPVTSPYGYRMHPVLGYERLHTGLDIGAPYGAPVWAAEAGTASYVGVMSGYGNVVIIDHGGGLATTYNHLSAFLVEQGQHVSRGEQIALVGATGMVTGPHLHFEVRVDGTPVDPMPYLR